MLFFHAIWSSSAGAAVAAAALADFKHSLAGQGQMLLREGPSSVSCVALPSSLPVPNRGVFERDGLLHVVPYGVVTDDGAGHDLASEATQSFVSRFLARTNTSMPLAPFSAIALDHRKNQITLRQDFIGSGRLHVYDQRGLVIVSNHTFPLRSLRAGLDTTALADFAVCGWVMGDRTFSQGFRQPGADESLSYRSWLGRIWRKTSGARELQPNARLTRADALIMMRDGLANIVGSIRETVGSEPLLVSLSGGRDSRLISAAFLHQRVPVTFSTIDNYAEETAIVRELLARAGAGDRHRVTSPARPQTTAASLLDSVRSLVRQHNGLYEPTYGGLRAPTSRWSSLLGKQVNISGAAGEMIHGHFYPKHPLEDLRSRSAAHIIAGLVGRLGSISIATPELRADFDRRLYARLLPMAATFAEPVRLLDYFYLAERQRRWSGLSADFHVVAPMANVSFCQASYSIPTEDIIASIVPRQLTESLVPQWAGIPYFKSTPQSNSKRPTLAQSDGLATFDLVSSYASLREVLDVSRLEQLCADWDGVPASRRDAVIKRAAWLGCVTESFAA